MEGLQLVVAGEVVCAVGGEDVLEEAEVLGDAVGEGAIGGGGEEERAAVGVLLPKEVEQGML